MLWVLELFSNDRKPIIDCSLRLNHLKLLPPYLLCRLLNLDKYINKNMIYITVSPVCA